MKTKKKWQKWIYVSIAIMLLLLIILPNENLFSKVISYFLGSVICVYVNYLLLKKLFND